ncbi:unnamed protein product [Dracunculus medinensis]|uniref:type I protein arginine methyltransferase n=1 Tax=Dracunculus medinensis TaxID=318479 RepID=A0A0N4UFX9_DRAME|nr:unnamed protein product [Dracunculus medinensis]
MSFRLYGSARILQLDENGECISFNNDSIVDLGISSDNHCIHIFGRAIRDSKLLISTTQFFRLNSRIIFLHSPSSKISNELSIILLVDTNLNDFITALRLCQSLKPREKPSPAKESEESKSVFDARTESASAMQYFQFYGYLAQQQNMMQDYVRTSTYQRAIHANSIDFNDKIVLDVGAGSGILSFFAVQAGARRVYAVEASSVAVNCAELVRANNLSDKIIVVAGRVEEITLPEQIDIIISEPMGYMLVNERMLESYIHARKFLKPGGRMFPTVGHLYIGLFSDEALFIEQYSKGNFWCQENFHGVNLTGIRTQALLEIFKQPIVDTWHVNTLMSGTIKWTINFEKDPESKLHNITIPFQLTANRTGFIHGIATWFDVAFVGSSETIWLSTSPTEPLTHWYQVRCLFDRPLMVFIGQTVNGCLSMVANERQSYDIVLTAEVGTMLAHNTLDLKNPFFRYTAAAVIPPAGFNNEAPSDNLLQQNGIIIFSLDILGGRFIISGVGNAGAINHMEYSLDGATSMSNGCSESMPNSGSTSVPQFLSAQNSLVPNDGSTNIIDILSNSHSQLTQEQQLVETGY